MADYESNVGDVGGYDNGGGFYNPTAYNPIHISKEFREMNKGRLANDNSFLVKYGRNRYLSGEDSWERKRQIAWFALLAKKEIPLWDIPMRADFVAFNKTVRQPLLLNRGFKRV